MWLGLGTLLLVNVFSYIPCLDSKIWFVVGVWNCVAVARAQPLFHSTMTATATEEYAVMLVRPFDAACRGWVGTNPASVGQSFV